MKKLKCLLLILVLSFSIDTEVYAQVSKQDAIDFVFDSIVMNRVDSVNVYIEPAIQNCEYYIMSPYDSIQSPYNSFWLFFIDENPEYDWGHNCEYVLIDSYSRSHWSVKRRLPPLRYLLVLEELSAPVKLNNLVFNFNVHYSPQTVTIENNHLFAVLFCGGELGVNDYKWSALSHMFCGLIEQGYSKDQIYVLSYDGTEGVETNENLDLDNDNYDDILPIPCSSENLGLLFQQLENEMEEGDLLYIFANTHGDIDEVPIEFQSYFVLWENELLIDSVFANMVEGISCSQIIFNLSACYSGGFTDDLVALNNSAKKTILTSTNSSLPYLRNIPFCEKSMMDTYNYLVCSEFRGFHPDHFNNAPWVQLAKIGEHPNFDTLFPGKSEKNFDLQENNGNDNGIQEINEIVSYVTEYDWQFSERGTKISDCGFQEDLLSLIGLSGKVENTQTVEGNFLIGGPLTVENNTTLTLSQGSSFNIVNTDITVNSSGNLILSDETSVYGESSSSLNVIGNINVGEKVNFESKDETILEINLGYNPVNISDNCRFVNCAVNSSSDPINISYSTFDNSTFSAVNNSSGLIPYTTNLIHNTFTAEHSEQDAIYLYNYTEFNINDNSINGYYNGISLNSSGSSTNINRQLNNNTINDCGMYAVNIYNSAAVLAQNHIYENIRGIGSLNRSNVNIYGNPLAEDYSEVNLIEDNSSYELYSSSESFPWYFRYNAIFDEDNQGVQSDALIYNEGSQYYADVNYNC